MKRFRALLVTALAAGTAGYAVGTFEKSGAQAQVETASPSPSQATTAPALAPPLDGALVEVHGRVVDERGRPVAGAVVVARDLDSEIVLASSPTGPVDPSTEGVVTGADGQFSLSNLPPGRYVLVAIHGHHSPGRSGPVVVIRNGRALAIEIALDSESIRA
jgi:hypothetical protein